MTKPAIYLASASPRRRELLTQIGVPFELLRCEIDETPLAGELPHPYVARLARAKAEAGVAAYRAAGLPPRLLLAADTTVALGEAILGKPVDVADAEAMLASLSGKSHQVMTGVAVTDGERVEVVVSVSQVRFRILSAAEIRSYVATGEPMDKAGSYGAQGKGALLIAAMEGSFSGVIGLPLAETGALLQGFDYPIW
ncbi:septum formation inhibitor Maf [Chitinimonas arctica]|uniref:dTTP/UTP pyrophosphatase n=1 Tax=Chitinimonas arctica TaxID=2594795 RepID=A0A516SGD9_9NEIS|nr:Maf family protein [Chitinimonas arctica]QDQ27225.1 septum formation inhibitor Maf [Chitinimonas arctica]